MKKLKKEEIADDYCFVCKDGGQLRICDYRDCLKCYHPKCEHKEESFLDSEERWTCRWHQCSLCHRPSKFQCFTCPMAVCGFDIYYTEFSQVKGQKGFCGQCLRLASLVEKNKDVVSDKGEKVDFEEEAIDDLWFREYYEIVKEKEGLTGQMTLSAMAALEKGKQIRPEPDNEDIYHSEDDGLVSDYDDIGDEEPPACGVKKKRKRPSGRMRKSDKSNALKFDGWGSKSLIAFLISIGEDTTERLSQCDVDSIIRRYIHSNKLVKKKMVSCDEKLQSLFLRKSVKIHRISGLLESHFAENAEHLDKGYGINATSLDEEDDSSTQPCQSEKKIISNRKSSESETPSTKKGCYADIIAENIKLVYVRRTLLEKLLKGEPETAEDKLVGSFVRIKSDPYDCMQTNSYQLVKITGVNQALCSGQTIFSLQVSNRIKSITVSDISEEDFTSEECDDLRQRVKACLLDRITIVDLEQKARMLHEDITKHWITRRLAILQNLIDRANEKGWRRELYEYLEAKDLLQTEAEQSRLLHEVPTVIADETIDPPFTAPAPESINKPENELPQGIESESSSFLNDPDSPGAKSSNVIEVYKLQPKEGSSKKLQDFNSLLLLRPTLSAADTLSTTCIPSVLGMKAISEPAAADTSSLSTANISPVNLRAISEPAVEDTSSPSSRVSQTNIFLNCLKLDFRTLLASNNQSSLLQSLTALSKVGDFSLKQIEAMENLIYEIPRLTSDYQFAEETSLLFQQYMKSHSSVLEDAKRYMAEKESVEVHEKSARESSLNIQEEIRKLQLKLKAINSEKKSLLSQKLALDCKIKDTNAKLAKSNSDIDTWKIRQQKAIKERETVHVAWESFKKQFPNINDPAMISVLPSAEVMQQQTPNTCREIGIDVKKEPSLIATSEALTKVKSEEQIEDICSNTVAPGTFSLHAAPNSVHSPYISSTLGEIPAFMPQNFWFGKPDTPQISPFNYFP